MTITMLNDTDNDNDNDNDNDDDNDNGIETDAFQSQVQKQ